MARVVLLPDDIKKIQRMHEFSFNSDLPLLNAILNIDDDGERTLENNKFDTIESRKIKDFLIENGVTVDIIDFVQLLYDNYIKYVILGEEKIYEEIHIEANGDKPNYYLFACKLFQSLGYDIDEIYDDYYNYFGVLCYKIDVCLE